MKKLHTLLVCLSLLPLSLAQAETRYITDVAKITMRTGESTSHRIIRIFSSGVPVEILEDNRETGYSKVRSNKGEIGYILTNQLMNEPSARDQLAKLQAKMQELTSEPEELRSKLSNLQTEHQELMAAHKELQSIKSRQEEDLQSIQRTAANAIQISSERNELRKQVASLTRQVADLNQENRDLRNEDTQNWFLIGAGVIIAGIILGLILPHLRFQRRRDSWGSL